MKKLMIAAAIVCAAVVSQGAAVNWSAGTGMNVQGPKSATDGTFSGTVLASPAVMAITLYQFDSVTARDAYKTSADIYAAHAAGSITATRSNTSTASGNTLAIGATAKVDVQALVTGSEVPLYALYVITLDSNGDGTVDWYIADTANSKITTQGKATGISNLVTNGHTGWTAVASTPVIPEPTSGLLLLLGVAGLALRRRRA